MMNQTWKRTLISVAVAIVVYFVGELLLGFDGIYYTNAGDLYIAAVIAGGCYWIGSKE